MFAVFFLLLLSRGYAFSNGKNPERQYKKFLQKITKIKSGKISYELDKKPFYKSNSRKDLYQLEYTRSETDSNKYALWIHIPELGVDEIYSNDTAHTVWHKKKVITWKRMTPGEYRDEVSNDLSNFTFGIPGSIIKKTLSTDTLFSDTIINRNAFVKILKTNKLKGHNADSTETSFIFSLEDNNKMTFENKIWRDGEVQIFQEKNRQAVYSDFFDIFLAKRIHDYLHHLLRDSNYTLVAEDDFSPFQDSGKQKFIQVGDTFLSAGYQTIAGEDIDISEFHSKLTLLDFSYMACEPCRQSIPFIVNLFKKYQDSGLRIWGIDPFDKKEKDIFLRYASRYHIDFPMLFTDKTKMKEIGINGYPTYVLLDKNMKVLSVFNGFGPLSVDSFLEPQIKDFLRR